MKTNATLIVPIAGRGQRFVDKGFINPKPLIIAGDRHIIDYSFDSIDITEYDKIIFIVRKDHVERFSIDEVLKKKFGGNVTIVESDGITGGSVCSCLLAEKHVNWEAPLVIYTLDVTFYPTFRLSNVPESSDGHILTFQANNPGYSYVKCDEEGKVIQTAEKKVISNKAAVGIYYFKYAGEFFKFSTQMVEAAETTNGEYYICPVFNKFDMTQTVTCSEVEEMHVMGTPDELDFFVTRVLPKFGNKPIAVCSDHSGFESKEMFIQALNDYSIPYINFGTFTSKDSDYNDFVTQACQHIQKGLCDFGVGFCRSGQGVNMSANKFKGIRSALIYDLGSARLARLHNCSNFFAIPSRVFSDPEDLCKLIDRFKTSFEGGRHADRIKKMENNANI